MPPKAIKSVRDIIFWQFASIIFNASRDLEKMLQFIVKQTEAIIVN